MARPTIEVKVPGKLFIAGEYAVLERGQSAVVIAVDRYMKGTIAPSKQNILSLPQLGYDEIQWTSQDDEIEFNVPAEKLVFIKNALRLTHQLLREKGIEPDPIKLTVTSELDDNGTGKKYGLGSSAAIVVTVITALLHFYKNSIIEPTKENIYKLAAIAHYLTQGNGSCADIAASTYGGWLHYAMFQPEWLIEKIQTRTNLSKLLASNWPGLIIRRLTSPEHLYLAVGWTKESVSTAPMVKSIQSLRDKNYSLYEEFLYKSQQAVNQFIASFSELDHIGAVQALAANRQALMHLSELATVDIETPKLKRLIEIANQYGSGKSSGAGGGDCGIAFTIDSANIQRLYEEWTTADILPLPIMVSELGATAMIIDEH